MNNNVLEFGSVWKTYTIGDENLNALAGLNLALKKGSFTAVMGPSGSGKSTFLHVAGILDIPTSGIIKINAVLILRRADKNNSGNDRYNCRHHDKFNQSITA